MVCVGRYNTLSLLLANMPEVTFPANISKILVQKFQNIIRLEAVYERTSDIERVGEIVEEIDSMMDSLRQNMDSEFMHVYPHFFAAFGRMQQYISFVKR